MMKIFLDTANIDHIKEAVSLGEYVENALTDLELGLVDGLAIPVPVAIPSVPVAIPALALVVVPVAVATVLTLVISLVALGRYLGCDSGNGLGCVFRKHGWVEFVGFQDRCDQLGLLKSLVIDVDRGRHLA